MQNDVFVKMMMTSIEQLVDDRINKKLKELQDKMDAENDQNSQANDDEYLTIGELCALTGLKKATIYAKRSRRELPAYKFGRELRFRRSEIETWIQTKRQTCLVNGEERRPV